MIEAVAGAVRSVSGVRLLDVSSNPDHNRTVLTFVGIPEQVAEAAFRGTASETRTARTNRLVSHCPCTCSVVPVSFREIREHFTSYKTSNIEAGLRAFERDYRARLRGFVEGQLKALEDAAPSGPVAPPQPPGIGGNSRPLPGSEDLPALSTGARQNSYSALRDSGDQLGHNGRDRVDRLRHDD